VEDREQELGLVAELVIEGPDRDSGRLEDVVAQVGAGETAACEGPAACLEQAAAGVLGARAAARLSESVRHLSRIKILEGRFNADP
jgi:hypothetical protein